MVSKQRFPAPLGKGKLARCQFYTKWILLPMFQNIAEHTVAVAKKIAALNISMASDLHVAPVLLFLLALWNLNDFSPLAVCVDRWVHCGEAFLIFSASAAASAAG